MVALPKEIVNVVRSKDSNRYVFAVKPEEGQNFWDANPELEYMEPYAAFKKKEGKRRSGRIMTAIWMVYDPKSRAQQSSREEEEVLKDISTNFLNEKKFDWNEHRKVITAFKKDCKTKIEKELEYWEIELKTRRVYQRSLPWETERKEKDEMLRTQKQLFQDYLSVVAEVNKERAEGRLYGGTHKSLLERQQS